MAPRDGDIDSLTPGRRERADRRPWLLFVNDSVAYALSCLSGRARGRQSFAVVAW